MKVRIKRTVNPLGPIRSATMEFSDLTVLVGPQATGKSILVQLLKLLVDTAHIKYEFRRAGIDWFCRSWCGRRASGSSSPFCWDSIGC